MRERWMRIVKVCSFGIVTLVCSQANAQSGQYVQDPNTGQMYRREYKTIEEPKVETRWEQKEITISRPEVVTEMEPVQSTYFTPVVRYGWQPRWHNTWNPFATPTLAYHFVPTTTWEAKTETVHRARYSTRWVSEQKVVNEPQRVASIQTRQVVELVPVNGPVPQGTTPTQRFATRPDAMPAQVLGMDPYATRPATGSYYR